MTMLENKQLTEVKQAEVIGINNRVNNEIIEKYNIIVNEFNASVAFENNILKNRIVELENKNSTLNNKLCSIDGQLKQLNKDINFKVNTLMEKERQEYKKQLEQARTERKSVVLRQAGMTDAIQANQKANEAIIAKQEAEKNQKIAESERDMLSEHSKVLQTENNRLHSQLEELDKHINELKKVNESLKEQTKEYKELNKQYEKLITENIEVNKKHEELKEAVRENNNNKAKEIVNKEDMDTKKRYAKVYHLLIDLDKNKKDVALEIGTTASNLTRILNTRSWKEFFDEKNKQSGLTWEQSPWYVSYNKK